MIAHGVYAWVPEPVRDDLLARDPRAPRRRRARLRLLQRQPGRLHAPRAARGRAVVRRDEAGLDRARRAGARAVPVPAREPRRHQRLVGRAAREPAAGARARGRCTGSCTTTSASTGRRSGSPTSPSARRRSGLAYVGDADLDNLLPGRVPDGRRGRAGRDRRRGPDPPRAAHRRAALRLLPPVRAVPRQPPAGRRPGRRGAARTCTSPRAPASRATSSRTGCSAPRSTLLRSRAPDTLAFAELRAATERRPRRALGEALHQGSSPSS